MSEYERRGKKKENEKILREQRGRERKPVKKKERENRQKIQEMKVEGV